MKPYKLSHIFMAISSCLTISACGDDSAEGIHRICEISTDQEILNSQGRIYLFSSTLEDFYYIGDPDLEGTGYIPCNMEEFNFDKGDLVEFSGEIRRAFQGEDEDPYDPLFDGIVLYSIEIVKN